MTKLTWGKVARWRVRRHFLDRRAPAGNALTTASRLCGLHAQVLSSAELTLWARVEGLQRGAVQRAIWEDRTLVKTWAMRGTLHLLPSDEFPLWTAALSGCGRFLRSAAWQNYFGVTVEELDCITEAIAAALDGQVITREELMREVGRITGSPALGAKVAESSWGTILRPAAFSGRLCFGPSLGTRVRFTHPASWLAERAASAPVDSGAATAEVARRFLAAYGPATYRDMARWWGHGGIAGARQWIAALGEQAQPVAVDGAQAWMLAGDLREALDLPPARSVRLLPGFDQYVVAASCHADSLMPGDFRGRIFRPQGWISPVLLVNGRMQGVWRHELKGSRVEVAIEPFVSARAWVRRAASEEAERLAGFFGGQLKLQWKRCAA